MEVDGELEVTAETEQNVGCAGWGAAESHGRRTVVVRDVDVFGRLRWVKRLWRCCESACARRTWTERHPAVKGRATLLACRDNLTEGHTFTTPRDTARLRRDLNGH